MSVSPSARIWRSNCSAVEGSQSPGLVAARIRRPGGSPIADDGEVFYLVTQVLHQAHLGGGKARRDSSLRDVQRGPDLTVAVPVEVSQHYHLRLTGGQFLQRLQKVKGVRGRGDVRYRLGSPQSPEGLSDLAHGLSAPVGDGYVDGDAVEPRLDGSLRPKFGPGHVSPLEALLGAILCLRSIAHDGGRSLEDPSSEVTVEPVEVGV